MADGMDVINLSLGEAEVEPSRDLVVHAIEGAAKAGVVPVIAAGNDFDQFGYGTVSSPGERSRRDHRRGDDRRPGRSPTSPPPGPRPSRCSSSPTSAPRASGSPRRSRTTRTARTASSSGHEHGDAARRRRRRAPQAAPPDWTVAADQVGTRPDRRSRPRPTTASEASVLRQGGGLIDLAAADNPLLFAAPTGITFPVNGGAAHGEPHRRRRRRGRVDGDDAFQEHAAGVTVAAPPSVTVPGELAVTATVAPTARNGRRDRVRDPHARQRHAPDPVLGRGRPSTARLASRTIPLDASGHLHGHHGGRRHARLALPLSDPRRHELSRPRGRLPRDITKPVANFGVAVLSGRAVPHVVFAGDENHLVGYPGLPDEHQPVLRHVRREPRRSPAPSSPCRAPTTSSSTSASEVARRPVHVPLLGQRHEAAPAAAAARPTRNGRRLDHRRRLRGRPALDPGHRRRRTRPACTSPRRGVVFAADPGSAQLVVTGLRPPGAEEHGGRREDQAQHGDARRGPSRRKGRLTA